MSPEAISVIGTFAIGLIGGILSGLFGVGAGTLLTPILDLVTTATQTVAMGLPSLGAFLGEVSASSVYVPKRIASIPDALVIGFAGIVPGFTGAMLSSYLDNSIQLIGMGCILVYSAWHTYRCWDQCDEPVEDERIDEEYMTTPHKWRLATIGVISGFVSGIFIVGVGFITIPLLERYGRLRYRQAIATSLLAGVFMNIPGLGYHIVRGQLDVTPALLLGSGVAIGAYIGARQSLRSKEKSLKVAYSILLAILGVWLVAVTVLATTTS